MAAASEHHSGGAGTRASMAWTCFPCCLHPQHRAVLTAQEILCAAPALGVAVGLVRPAPVGTEVQQPRPWLVGHCGGWHQATYTVTRSPLEKGVHLQCSSTPGCSVAGESAAAPLLGWQCVGLIVGLMALGGLEMDGCFSPPLIPFNCAFP